MIRNRKLKIFSILLGLTAAASYTVLPNYWMRNHSKHIIRRVQVRGFQIALTFDDGPDPGYTEELLDLLLEHDSKATFFVVAQKARKHPDLIRRMKAEGHTVAMHSLSHRIAWLSTPEMTRLEFAKSIKILKKLGVEARYFRPPWGTFNLCTAKESKARQLKIVLWSVELDDWLRETSPSSIFNRLKDCGPGDIVVLHDSGGENGAPNHMLDALRLFLPWCERKGVELINLDVGLD
ncbi:polysaccharide deacetylase family protein [Alkalibacter saccharofermentans]|uniref:Peptidoglycan/xylan/chitin deacetylase, PgdA/CDA1 family n=1 Tax=Alkalibacter saccharofermentans DSM 14828 TaxID=1120975 RepID=A0A1M4ZNF3_9FIRM|nr:polysaccharide deacetylase family protein [Alkalibacter saccharofermentans]SHF19569.1 Peptidoglycan/xylan/chitin deacetylase, PgdA/CDA1 family [Alkalibacter saccharofermentans DSM 14828]